MRRTRWAGERLIYPKVCEPDPSSAFRGIVYIVVSRRGTVAVATLTAPQQPEERAGGPVQRAHGTEFIELTPERTPD